MAFSSRNNTAKICANPDCQRLHHESTLNVSMAGIRIFLSYLLTVADPM